MGAEGDGEFGVRWVRERDYGMDGEKRAAECSSSTGKRVS